MKRGIVIRALGNSPDFLDERSLPSDLEGYKRAFALAAEHNFDGVQPYLALEGGFLSLNTSSSRLSKLAAAASAAGVALPSLEIAPLQYSLVADDRVERARGAEVVGRALEMAGELGCRGVLTIPGYVGLPWVAGGGDTVNYADAYDRLVDELGRLVERAESAGVSLYIENIWNMFLLSPLEMRRLIRDVNSTRIGVLLDIGNVTATGFAEQWVDILGPYLLEVHLKDYRRSVGTVEGFVPLLAGDVNWPSVMAALVRNAFGGYVIPEIFPYAHFGSVSLKHTETALDALLAHADGLRS